jgi:hypothetical protein
MSKTKDYKFKQHVQYQDPEPGSKRQHFYADKVYPLTEDQAREFAPYIERHRPAEVAESDSADSEQEKPEGNGDDSSEKGQSENPDANDDESSSEDQSSEGADKKSGIFGLGKNKSKDAADKGGKSK